MARTPSLLHALLPRGFEEWRRRKAFSFESLVPDESWQIGRSLLLFLAPRGGLATRLSFQRPPFLLIWAERVKPRKWFSIFAPPRARSTLELAAAAASVAGLSLSLISGGEVDFEEDLLLPLLWLHPSLRSWVAWRKYSVSVGFLFGPPEDPLSQIVRHWSTIITAAKLEENRSETAWVSNLDYFWLQHWWKKF